MEAGGNVEKVVENFMKFLIFHWIPDLLNAKTIDWISYIYIYIEMPQNLIIAFLAVLITFLLEGLPSVKFACKGTTQRVTTSSDGCWDTETVLWMLVLPDATVYLTPLVGGGIPTNLFSESLTLTVYHNFIKTFHGFVLGRVSTSPPKSCLAVPKVVEYTVTQVDDDIVKGCER